MRLGLALALSTAACGGGASQPATPGAVGPLRLVGCAPALPAPRAGGDAFHDALLGALEGNLEQLGTVQTVIGIGGGGRRIEPETGRLGKRTADVALGMPTATAMMDSMVVRRVVAAKLPELRDCFARELERNRTLTTAAMAWRFSIAPDGRVLNPAPVPTALRPATSPGFGMCVSLAFRSMVFPARRSGGSISVTYPLVFEAKLAPPVPVVPDGDQVATRAPAWRPFALDPPTTPADTVARLTEAAVRGRLDRAAACFGRSAPGGSLRVLLAIDDQGGLASARAGGLGAPASERCVEQALAGLGVVSMVGDASEVACDFARGDAQPWRVAPAANYEVVTATRTELRHGAQTVTAGASPPEPLPDRQTYLVVAERETPGNLLALALAWVTDGDAAVIAVRDGERAPLYVGMGRISNVDGAEDPATGTHAALRLGARTLAACVGRARQQVSLGDASGVGSLVQRLATRCKRVRCAGTLTVAIDPDARALDLVEVSGAARRAGFDRVLIGDAGQCQARDPEVERAGGE